LCGAFEESVEHCILLCSWTECTWFGSSIGIHIPKQAITTFDDWLLSFVNLPFPNNCTKKEILSLFSFMAWNIGKERCEAVFKAKEPSPTNTINTAARHCFEFSNAKSHVLKPLPPSPTPIESIWSPPADPWVKINVDGAWDHHSSIAGSGVIIRDKSAMFIAGSSTVAKANSVIEAEAMALVGGVKLALQLKLDHVIMESDSQELISALDNRIERGNWRIYPILIEFHRLRALLNNVSWRWISREANRAADAAAKLAKLRLCTEVWVNGPPTCLVSVLTSDGLPCPH
jgi:ribonuclease HI